MRRLALLLLLGLALGGCYDTPKPPCAFLCGAGGECPDDYQCGGDNRCHRVESGGTLAVCEDQLPIDAAVVDAPVDAQVADAPVVDAAPVIDAVPAIDADPTAPDAAPNEQPVLTLTPPGPSYTAVAGDAFGIVASATDPNVADTLTKTAAHSGANDDPFGQRTAGDTVGSVFTSSSGTYALPAGILGTFGLRISVSDGRGGLDSEDVTITVGAHPVMLNEVSIAAGAENVEIVNTGSGAVDLSNWQLCAPFDYYTIPSGTSIPASGFIVIHWDQTNTNTATDLFTGARSVTLASIGQLVLYGTPAGGGHLSREQRDYAKWSGTNTAIRAPEAIFARQWPSGANNINTGGLGAGETIARARSTNTESPNDWCVQTASLGSINALCP